MPCRSGEPSEYEVQMLKTHNLEKKVRDLETSNCLMMDFLLGSDQLKNFKDYEANLLQEEFKIHREEDLQITLDKYFKQMASLMGELKWYQSIKESHEDWVQEKIKDYQARIEETRSLIKFLKQLSPEDILKRIYYNDKLIF